MKASGPSLELKAGLGFNSHCKGVLMAFNAGFGYAICQTSIFGQTE
ncbi:hypothetical protein [Pedobacter frigidisoli]|nr:hypothetical protein [Pedobacter frigidisoli]